MGTFMSPLDPVFWCHHNILDCLWVEWNINRNNPNTNDSNWINLHFTEFVDENGQAVDVAAGITTLMPAFDYQFEPCGPVQIQNKKVQSRAALEAFLKAGTPVRLDYTQRIEVTRTVSGQVGKPIASVAKIDVQTLRTVLESEGKTAALLTVDGVEVPQKTDFYVRAFLDKPDATPNTPITDPHFAGSFGFFQDAQAMAGMEAGAMHPRFGFVVDITPTLRRLNQGGGLSGPQLDITLVPVPYERREATGQRLGIERLELGIATVK
jgi:tyrosinase